MCFAEFETNLRRERQLEGIAAAKAKQAPRKAASGQSMKPGSAGYDHKAWDPPRSPVSWGSAVPPSIGLGLMVKGGRKRIPGEALINLRRRLDMPCRPGIPHRTTLLQSVRQVLDGVSRATLYRSTPATPVRPKPIRRVAPGQAAQAAGVRAGALLRDDRRHEGADHQQEGAPPFDGAPPVAGASSASRPRMASSGAAGPLTRDDRNRYLRRDGAIDHARMTRHPPAVRFQAGRANELWHFDLSPSDLKDVKEPLWVEPGRRRLRR